MPQSRFAAPETSEGNPPKHGVASRRRKYKRAGSITQAEKNLVANFVADHPSGLVPSQERALAVVLNRTPATAKKLIEEARGRFLARANDYVDMHFKAATNALESGDHETAMKGAQWFMEHAGEGTIRIAEKAKPAATESAKPTFQIGIKLGGLTSDPAISVPTTAVEGQTVES